MSQEGGGELAAKKLTPCALEREIRRTELDYCVPIACIENSSGAEPWTERFDYGLWNTWVNKNPLDIILLCVCLFFSN